MPCNGVAVASGRVNSFITDYIKDADKETLKATLIQLIKNQFPQLADKEVETLPYRYGVGADYISFKLGRYLFEVQDYGKVTASVSRQSSAQDAETCRQMQELMVNLLTGLAGISLQQRVLAQIKNAGGQVTGQQTAPNGALVLSVEV